MMHWLSARTRVGTAACGSVLTEACAARQPGRARRSLCRDVHAFPGHIACAASTRSEIVVPILTPDVQDTGVRLLAVLDVDSDDPDAFDETDQQYLERLCAMLGEQFAETPQR